MYTKVVSVISTGAATQDITFTPNSPDPSWTPKIAIFNWSRANASQGAFAEHMSTGFGFTNGTASRCVAIASEDNQARGDSARIQRNDALICTLLPSGIIETVDSIATFNSWLTNGIRINWTDAPAANFYINITFIGGLDITNVDVGTLATGTGTGDISVTSLAYQPDFGFFLSGMNATDNTATINALMSIGAATSSSAQWNESFLTQDNPVTMITRQYYSHTKTVVSISTAGAVDGYATFSSFNSNGFTLNVGDAFPASHNIYYLVVKGGSWAVGNATEPASTGNQTITTSKDTKGLMMFGLKTATADTPQNGQMSSVASCDSLKNCAYVLYEDQNGVADSVVVTILSTTAIYAMMSANITAGSSTTQDSAGVFSLGSTGFVIQWTNVGGARPWRYISFGTGVVLSQVTKTSTLLYDIIGQVTKSNTLKYDVRAEITKQLTTKYNITVPVEKTNTLKYDIRKEVTKQLSILYNVISQITKQLNLLYDVRQEVTDTTTIKFDIRVPITKQVTILYNVLKEVTKTNTVRYDVIAQVTKAVNILYNIATTVEKINQLKYNINAEVTKTNTLLYNISNTVTKTNILLYNILQEASKSVTVRYDLIAEVTKIINLLYDIESAIATVTKTLSLRYNIDAQVTKTANILYNINVPVTKTNTLRYDIRKEVTKTVTTLYNIQAQVTKILNLLYNINQEVTKTNTVRYNINTFVEKTNTILYNILKEVTKTNSLRYDVISQVTKTNTLLYDIEAAFGVVVKTLTLAFDIKQEVQKSVTIRYDILKSVEKQVTLRFNLLKEVLKTNTLLYNIIAQTTKSTTVRYNINNLVEKTNTLRYNINTYVEATKTLRYDIKQEAEKDTTLLYNVIAQVTKTNTLQYNILNEVTKSNTLLFNILQEAEKNVTLRYDVKAEVEKLLQLRYNILKSIVKTTSLIYNILPLTAIEHATMHEQLLDYIYSQYSLSNPAKNSPSLAWHEWYNGISDITIDTTFISLTPIDKRSTVIYKEKSYQCAIHVWYRDYNDDENTPIELANVLKEIGSILNRSRYNMVNEFQQRVYEMRIRDERFIPDENSKGSDTKVLHYRYIVEMIYQKLIT